MLVYAIFSHLIVVSVITSNLARKNKHVSF